MGYLITFRAFGTWLHGDERGSIDRHQNVHRTPYISPSEQWRGYNGSKLKKPPVKLDARRRKVVRKAIEETCEKRGWRLLAQNVRTNHAHAVVMIGDEKSSKALNAFKANATRALREIGLWTDDSSPWADKGCRRPLWTELAVSRAINYVVNGQGGPLPELD